MNQKKNRATQNWLSETKLFFFVIWAEEEKNSVKIVGTFESLTTKRNVKCTRGTKSFLVIRLQRKKVFAYTPVIKADKIIKDFARFFFVVDFDDSMQLNETFSKITIL